MTVIVVYTTEHTFSFTGGCLFMDDRPLDGDRLLTNLEYLDRITQGLSPLCVYVLRFIQFMDHGAYFIYSTSRGTSYNLLSGCCATSREFSNLFSFGSRLKALLEPCG